MKNRIGKIGLHDTHIGLWENEVDEEGLRVVYGQIIRWLRDRGFTIHRCRRTMKHYPSLSHRHHRGNKKSLEIKINYCGRCLEIDFFQNLIFENKNGGEYDFDKYLKMPYLMRKQFVLEASKIIDFLTSAYGYGLSKTLELLGAPTTVRIVAAIQGINGSLYPLERFNQMWGADRFKRDATGWPRLDQYDECGRNRDRDGIPLRNGMVRYFRREDGRLARGRIFTNMNNMWQVICGPGGKDSNYMACWELFSPTVGDCPKRWFSDQYRSDKISAALKVAINEMNFERAAVLRDILGLKSRQRNRTTSARPDGVHKKEKALKNRANLEAASGFEPDQSPQRPEN